MWKIALYGTDVDHQLDGNGELVLTSLPLNPATNSEWLKVNIFGASPTYADESEQLNTPGGYQIDKALLRRQLTLQLESADFTDDMSIIENLKDLRLKKEIYLYNIDYPVALHKSGYAVRINIKTTVEDDFENGVKNIIINVVKTKAE